MLCHLHWPPKDSPFMIILCEKFGEKAVTVDQHHLKIITDPPELAVKIAEGFGEIRTFLS